MVNFKTLRPEIPIGTNKILGLHLIHACAL